LPLAGLSLLKALPSILFLALPYIALTVLFGLFVFVNGGIVLGDKTNHVPAVHIPQLYYFYCFATALGWPVLLAAPGGPLNLLGDVRRMLFGSRGSTILATITLLLIGYTIEKFTIHHPFLLSDNRHYTFYVWHRFFLVHPKAPLVYAPVYLVTFCTWCIRIGSKQTLLQVLLLPVFLVPLLLPTPLLEPRYFIIPYLFLRAQVTNMPKWALIIEGTWYTAINGITMYAFLYLERPGVGRFMW